MSEVIIHCPFCGSPGAVVADSCEDNPEWWAACCGRRKCTMLGPFSSEEEAGNYWNCRQGPEQMWASLLDFVVHTLFRHENRPKYGEEAPTLRRIISRSVMGFETTDGVYATYFRDRELHRSLTRPVELKSSAKAEGFSPTPRTGQ